MYHSTTIVGSLLFLLIGSIEGQNNLQFCDVRPCVIPLAESCASLKENNDFFGSCCYFEDIVGTGGCRISVYAGGNCAWWPKCGNCEKDAGCGIEYQTRTTEACPADEYDVLGLRTPPATAPPTAMNGGTAAPTIANFTFPPTTAPTCPAEPTAAPDKKTDEVKDSAESAKATLFLLSLSVMATLYLAIL